MNHVDGAIAGRLLLSAAGLDRSILLVNAAEVADAFLRVTAGWRIQPAEGVTAAACVTVTGGPTGYTVASEWLPEPLAGLNAVGAVCGLIVDMSLAWLAARPELVGLHCGAVEIGGRLVAVTGGRRAGKSTLIARLSMVAARVYCDDILPVEENGGRGVALGVAPRLRLPLPRPAFRAHVVVHLTIADNRYGYLRTATLAPHGAAAPVGTVLLLDRRPRVRARLMPAAAGEAARMLLLRNLTPDRDPETLLARIVALIGGAEVFWLEFSDLERAALLVEESLGGGTAERGRARRAAHPSRGGLAAPGAAPGHAAPPDVRYVRRPGIASRSLGADLFLCDGDARSVLHLNATGQALWTLLEDGASPSEAAAALTLAYPGVGRQRIAADVARAFEAMEAAEVILRA